MPDKNVNQKMHRPNIYYDISLEDIKNKVGSSERFNAINSVFNHFDEADGSKDGIISNKIFNRNACGDNIFDEMTIYETTKNKELYNSEYEAILDDRKINEYLSKHNDLKDVTAQDVKTLLSSMEDINKEKSIQEEQEKQAKAIADKKTKFPKLPEEVLSEIDLEDKIIPTEIQGKQYYIKDYGDIKIRLNEKGSIVSLQQKFNSSENDSLGSGEQFELYDEEKGLVGGEKIADIKAYDYGFTDANIYSTKTHTESFRNAQFNYSLEENDEINLQDIVLNGDSTNETRLKCEYDENEKVKDIKIIPKQDLPEKSSTQNLPIEINETEKEKLKNLINSNAKFGEEFMLDLSNNNLKIVPVLRDESGNMIPNIPDSLKNDMLNLLQNRFSKGKDFDIKINGRNFELYLNSAKARDYKDGEIKTTYSSNTKTEIKSIGDERTKTTNNGNTTTEVKENISDKLLEKLLIGDFKTAGDYLGQAKDLNLYPICKKYQDMTGKNLMSEVLDQYNYEKIDSKIIELLAPTINWSENTQIGFKTVQAEYDNNMQTFSKLNDFDIKKSQIGKELYSLNKKEIISDNQYTQQIGNNSYKVTETGDSIQIEKDNKAYSIKLKGADENLKRLIYNSNASNLYRVASLGIKLGFKELDPNQEAKFDIKNNVLYLDPEKITENKIEQSFANGVGHTYYTEYSPKNYDIEMTFSEELYNFYKSNDRLNSTDFSVCANDIYEMVAESAALLTTGKAKSEYTIANYFPKTFAIAKQIIEEEEKK